MLLNTVDDLITYLGRAVMSATTDEFLRPYIAQANEDVFEKALGTDFMAILDVKHTDPDATAQYKALIAKVQRSLAWFAYLRYLPFSIGNDGDNGLQEVSTDNTQPVRIGVLDKRIRESEKNAVNSLESVLQYIEQNLDAFTEFRDSDTAKETRALFVPSATVMSEFLPQVAGNSRLFLNIKPYIKLAERDYFLPRLGKAQYDRLKTALKERTLTTDETELLAVIRRALAHTAYWLALPNLQFVMLGNGNIRILSDFDGIYNSKAPDQETVLGMVRGAESEAKKWQNALRAFLSRNLGKFPLYAESQAAKVEPANKLPNNDAYTSIFRLK
jgi:hypothetical protein